MLLQAISDALTVMYRKYDLIQSFMIITTFAELSDWSRNLETKSPLPPPQKKNNKAEMTYWLNTWFFVFLLKLLARNNYSKP